MRLLPRLPRTTSYDLVLVVVVLALTLLGIAMVYSASGIKALDALDDPRYFLGWQSLWAALGLVGMLAATRVDYHRYRLFALPLLVVAVALLAAVLFPGVGTSVNGAARWLRAGPVGVQPAELAKLALILYLAAWLGARRERIASPGVMVGVTVITGILTALVFLEPDLGTAIVIGVVALVMYFAAGARIRVFAALGSLAVVVALAGALTSDYRLQRIVTFLDPWSDPQNKGYQAIQSLYGLALGGLFGEGLGAGREKFGYLPFPYTDSIFAILGDELGLAGTLAVIALFLVLGYRGVRIALRAPDAMGALIATGITTWLVFQAWVNMAVVASLVPMTGITLPFISYGGSSLCVGLIAVGILLNVGRQAAPAPATVPRAPRRRRDGRARKPAARDRGGAARDRSRGGIPFPRWSSRARG
ncbi:MAG TPA: putative lipid II flippase FtsW [Candidatus Limnocylindria bacterium]|jgi:cell division protein FtsW|nr:putative lipid II flippase FtsW [Candidatus Limnocylindria bacterium]